MWVFYSIRFLEECSWAIFGIAIIFRKGQGFIMDKITFIYRRPLITAQLTSVEADCDLTDNLVSLAESHFPEKFKYIHFPDYYADHDMMTFHRCFPYVMQGDYIRWNVPYDEVTIGDFFRTHEIQGNTTVYVAVDGVAGAFDDFCKFVIQSWLVIRPVLDTIGYAATAKDIVETVLKLFGRKKKRIPSFENFRRHIMTKGHWTKEELRQMEGLTDELGYQIIEALGYEKHDGDYWRNEYKVNQYMKQLERMSHPLEEPSIRSVLVAIDDMNIDWVYLCAIGSDNLQTKVYDGMSNILNKNSWIKYNELLSRWDLTAAAHEVQDTEFICQTELLIQEAADYLTAFVLQAEAEFEIM